MLFQSELLPMMSSYDPLAREAASIARAISHPVRLQILNELRGDGAYVMHLTSVLGRPQANISQHLMVLREAGLVIATREGMTVLYQIRDQRIEPVLDALFEISEDRISTRMAASTTRGMRRGGGRRRRGNCRCPRCSSE